MTIERIFNDVIKLNLDLFEDNRGIFFELYNKDFFSFHGIDNEFIQDNISFSKYKYTIRGMHTQKKTVSTSKIFIFNFWFNRGLFHRYSSKFRKFR